MGSDRSQAAEDASRRLAETSQEQARIGSGAGGKVSSLFDIMNQVGGTPQYLDSAYSAAGTSIQEAGANQQLLGFGQQQAQLRGVQGSGGNFSAGISPFAMGSQIANEVTSNRTRQLMAGVENVNNVTAGLMGQAGQMGNASLQATGAELQSIGQLPGYNKNAALAASLGSAAFSAYGGLSQYNAGRDRTGGYAASPGQPGHGYQPGIGVQAPGNVSTSLYGTNYYSALNPWNVAGGGR